MWMRSVFSAVACAVQIVGVSTTAHSLDQVQDHKSADEIARNMASTEPPQQKGVDYKAVVEGKMQEVARDPTSLIYQWGDPPQLGFTRLLLGPRHEGLVGCVRVKGKNAYGGYGDWKDFIYVINQNTGKLEANIDFPNPNKFMAALLRRGEISHDPHCPGGSSPDTEL